MVNTALRMRADSLNQAARLVWAYVFIVVATVAVLAVLAVTDPGQAPADAWWHAAIVAVFAVVLPLRLRTAGHGSPRAFVAVGVIAIVLVVVNVVEALIPGFLPAWMRIEMFGIAALMAAVGALILHTTVKSRRAEVS